MKTTLSILGGILSCFAINNIASKPNIECIKGYIENVNPQYADIMRQALQILYNQQKQKEFINEIKQTQDSCLKKVLNFFFPASDQGHLQSLGRSGVNLHRNIIESEERKEPFGKKVVRFIKLFAITVGDSNTLPNVGKKVSKYKATLNNLTERNQKQILKNFSSVINICQKLDNKNHEDIKNITFIKIISVSFLINIVNEDFSVLSLHEDEKITKQINTPELIDDRTFFWNLWTMGFQDGQALFKKIVENYKVQIVRTNSLSVNKYILGFDKPNVGWEGREFEARFGKSNREKFKIFWKMHGNGTSIKISKDIYLLGFERPFIQTLQKSSKPTVSRLRRRRSQINKTILSPIDPVYQQGWEAGLSFLKEIKKQDKKLQEKKIKTLSKNLFDPSSIMMCPDMPKEKHPEKYWKGLVEAIIAYFPMRNDVWKPFLMNLFLYDFGLWEARAQKKSDQLLAMSQVYNENPAYERGWNQGKKEKLPLFNSEFVCHDRYDITDKEDVEVIKEIVQISEIRPYCSSVGGYRWITDKFFPGYNLSPGQSINFSNCCENTALHTMLLLLLQPSNVFAAVPSCECMNFIIGLANQDPLGVSSGDNEGLILEIYQHLSKYLSEVIKKEDNSEFTKGPISRIWYCKSAKLDGDQSLLHEAMAGAINFARILQNLTGQRDNQEFNDKIQEIENLAQQKILLTKEGNSPAQIEQQLTTLICALFQQIFEIASPIFDYNVSFDFNDQDVWDIYGTLHVEKFEKSQNSPEERLFIKWDIDLISGHACIKNHDVF